MPNENGTCLPGTLLATLGESEHSLEVGFSAEITTVKKIFFLKKKEIRKKRRQASLRGGTLDRGC